MYNNQLMSAFNADPSQINLTQDEQSYLNDIGTAISRPHPYATSYGGSQHGQLQQQVVDNGVEQLGGYATEQVINTDYNVSNNDGSITNVVTGNTAVDTTAPRQKVDQEVELNEVVQSGDERSMLEFTNQYLTKLGDTSGQFDYQLKSERDGWLPALTSFGLTGLAAAIAKRQGADDRQVAIMMADATRRAGMTLSSNSDRIGRQANIEALEAKGYLEEDILQWLDTGKSSDLISNLRNRPFANAKDNKSSYYEKGDILPNGKAAPKTGTYTTHFTYNQTGVPEVANIHYDGNLEGKKLANDLAIEELKQGTKQREKQVAEQAEIANSMAISQETLQAINQAISAGDIAGGDHTGYIDQYTPTFFQDTQAADAAFQRAKNLLTIDNLDLMKGVLTDRDVKILRGAATSIDEKYQWGVNRQELLRVRAKIAQAIANAQAGIAPTQRQGVGTAEGQFTTGNDGNRYQYRNGSWYSVEG